MGRNQWIKRKRDGVRWRNRVNEISGQALEDLGFEAMATAGTVSTDEVLRLYDVLKTLAVYVGKEFDALVQMRLGEIELMTEVSQIISAVKLRRQWEDQILDHYKGDKVAALPERQRTARVLGVVGTGIVRLVQKETA